MRKSGKITRRYFLQLLVLLAGYGVTTKVFAGAASPGSEHVEQLSKKLLDILGEKNSAYIVGRKYIEKAPNEADPKQLVAMICSGSDDFRCDGEMLKKHVIMQSRSDFSNGRTVSVDGWVLSLTEARLYALASITQG